MGRTSGVTGQIAIAGTSVTSGSFTVDMTTVASDESRRDNQFRARMGRVDLPHLHVQAHAAHRLVVGPVGRHAGRGEGDRGPHPAGEHRRITVDLSAQRSGSALKVAGSFPIMFADWGIDNPSFGPAQTEDNGWSSCSCSVAEHGREPDVAFAARFGEWTFGP